MDDVEVTATLGEDLPDPPGEGHGLTEAAGHHDRELGEVGERGELGAGRDPKGVGVAVEVEGAHGGEAHAVVKLRPGRTREHLDAVSEGNELARQVAGVDPLAAAARVAPVDEKGDAILPWGRWTRAHSFGQGDLAAARPRRPRGGERFGEGARHETTF